MAASLNLRRRPDQDRHDDAGFRRFDCAAQRAFRRTDARRSSPPAALAWLARSVDHILTRFVRSRSTSAGHAVFMAFAPDPSYGRFDARVFGSKEVNVMSPDSSADPNSPAISFKSSGGLAGYLRACGQHCRRLQRRPARRVVSIMSGSNFGMAASAASWVEQQHEELLAHQHLELGQRAARAGIVRLPKPTQRFKAALVHHASGRPDVKQAANDRLPAGRRRPICDFSSAIRACSSSRCIGVHFLPGANGAEFGSMPTAA